MPLPQVGTWTAPDGQQLPVIAPPSHASFNVTVTVSVDGDVLQVLDAVALVLVQREWYRTRLADAIAKLTQAGLAP